MRPTPDVLLLGATGTTAGLIAARLAASGHTLLLAARDTARAEALAAGLPAGSVGGVRPLDLADPAGLAALVGGARLVLNTVGPFTRLAGPVIGAALAAGVPYVDIANEFTAVHELLERDAAARAAGVALVTGAAFGPGATESLVLRLRAAAGGGPLAEVEVAAAPATAYDTEGVRATVADVLPEGALSYRAGVLHREPLGSGVTRRVFGGAERTVLPAPLGDLAAARHSGGAATVTAYALAPGERGPFTEQDRSAAWARARTADGRTLSAELDCGEGFAFTAAVAAATVTRLLADPSRPGAWTACGRYGAELAEQAGAHITPARDAAPQGTAPQHAAVTR
ncbi:saccharopine dehydrogenase NADP-binding domain-containing protein [Kitasatospora phosalacinea]|uniref:saccharopine dehydrogenase NADP-binding domain-containing protein n=1 Tax=Kitasatospora phosalacinea TaxID=2065 RepID=UPI00364DB1F9